MNQISPIVEADTIRRTAAAAFAFLILLLTVPLLQAQDLPSQATGHVNDFGDFLTASEENALEQKLRSYRDTTTTVIAIATVESLEGEAIESVATELFNRWGLWEGDRDNGVLILISRDERQMRIEVGYGLEGAIPDIMAGRIIRNVLTPAFRNSDFYEGLDRATTILIELAAGEFEGNLAEQRTEGSDEAKDLIVFIIFLAFVIYASSRRGGGGKGKGMRRRRTLGPGGFILLGGGGFGGGGFGSGGGGGGFGGFGGGGGFGSGGGGASGGW